MRELLVRRRPLAADVGLLKEAREDHLKGAQVVSREARVVDEETGALLAAFAPAPDVEAGFLEEIKFGKSFRTAGMPSESRTFGYLPRVTIRRDFCTTCSLASEQPEVHARLLHMADQATSFLAAHNEPQARAQAALLSEKVLPCWRLPGGVFTSGIVNRNNALWYHHDRGNFRGSWSVMYATRSGLRGGLLYMPEFHLAFDFGKPALIAFDGQSILHGVSPIRAAAARVARFSVVFYAMDQMARCLTPEGELARIRKLKTDREQRRARGETKATDYARRSRTRPEKA